MVAPTAVAVKGAVTPTAGANGTNTPVPTLASAHTPAVGANGTGTPSPTLAGATPGLQVTLVAGNLQQPDDLAVGPDGQVYVTDVGDGTVKRIDPDGHGAVLVSGLREPEGMVFLPGGDLIIAEQGLNRLLRCNLITRRTALFLSLPNTTGQPGVDGIAFDDHTPGKPALIVPDSPNGKVLRVSLDGKQVETIGRGFVRPVAAWVEPDGNILVADEFGNRLQRLLVDGRVETLATLPEPDDIIEDRAGHIYVNTLSDGAIDAVDATTGASRVVVAGLLSPQGIAFDAQGALLATDPGHHRVVRVAVP